ncbi:MAG: OadG family protein [Lachnospiraceae bacterium]|nr:OadG family protein [Lachnospiraceae bacterium]
MNLETLETALVNTLIGMGTVFVILIVISLIISLFKYINKFEAALKKSKEPATPAPVAAPVVVEEVEEETDDLELVAVITAAVAACMGTENTDGFVVRSIRRSPNNRW